MPDKAPSDAARSLLAKVSENTTVAQEERILDALYPLIREEAMRELLRRTDACFSRQEVCDELVKIRDELDAHA